MPIGRHGAVVGSDADAGSLDAAHAVGVFETLYFGQRTIPQLVLGGVFERHPDLRFVFTENGSGTWLVDLAAGLDGFAMASNLPGSIVEMFAGKATAKLSMTPGEYCRKHVWHGLTPTPTAMARKDEIGLDKMMWGADFPHHEGTVPYTLKVLRGTLAGFPEDELRQLLAGNAAAFYGADLDFLQTIADEVGPTVAEVDVPLSDDELPEDPNFAMLLERYAGLSALIGAKSEG